MAQIFAEVRELRADGRAVLGTESGEELVLSAEMVRSVEAPGLTVSARVRVTTLGGRVTAVKVVVRSNALVVQTSTEAPKADAGRMADVDDTVWQWREGEVVDVGVYLGKLKDRANQMHDFHMARFATLALAPGDTVLFALSQASGAVERMQLVTRAVPGIGGEHPCDGDLEALLSGAKSKPMQALVRQMCQEKRMDWYWRTPETANNARPASDYLSPDALAVMRHATPEFKDLYSHQSDSLQALKNGRNVMVLTPTASGKTNCYNPAVFEALLGDSAATALYVFPLNALLGDQLGKLRKLAEGAAKVGREVRVAELRGGMQKSERDAILNAPPQIIVTNPEMLSFLLSQSNSGRIGQFFRNLRYVILDEAHFYRGLFGLHMSGIVRRLRLICARCGNGDPGPQFVLSSATVGRPEDLATRLTALDRKQFLLITKEQNGRAQPQRHWLMLDPYAGDGSAFTAHLHQAAEALVDCLILKADKPLKVLLFVRSFRELHAVQRIIDQMLDDRRRPDLKAKVEQYAGALMSHAQKMEVYKRFESTELRALVATNALEAGIDLGDLDVCILAGFPYHVMRMRQMAGRAGRRGEGMVIYVPDMARSVDRFYAERPIRLLSQPEEAFVIDADNPYVARRHVVAAAGLAGGVERRELDIFGGNTDRMVAEAVQAGVMRHLGSGSLAAQRQWDGAWAVNRIRGAEQDPWAICKAPPDQRHCAERGCLKAALDKSEDSDKTCEWLVQLLDRQYVYRETHPGAVFEATDGGLYRCEQIDEHNKLIHVKPLPEGFLKRTFPLEEIEVEFEEEMGRRSLADGARLVWGKARVTRYYTGYGEYTLLHRRRCRTCNATYDDQVLTCPACQKPTRSFLDQSDPEYFTFPPPYDNTVFSLTLETIACRLELPVELEHRLRVSAPCPIRSADHKLRDFLEAKPPFRDAQDISRASGLDGEAAAVAFDYFQKWEPGARRWQQDRERIALFPSVYGQCLCHNLRERLPEDRALAAFETVTGYPATKDKRHICRKCYEGALLLAAHTIEHVVAAEYPTVALGDSQDLGSTTYVIHPQTRQTTVVWYDTYEGGIGAAEKIFEQLEKLVQKAHVSLDCDCKSDTGCPRCIQLAKCDRDNEALSKIAAANLANLLLSMPAYIPAEPLYRPVSERQHHANRAHDAEHAKRDVPRPGEAAADAPLDPFEVLRVQRHVHDAVLQRITEVRGEEISGESPPMSIKALQDAYNRITQMQRPSEWRFDASWDAWQTLHVLQTASRKVAKAAHRVIARAIHPDQFDGDKALATRWMQQINDAWRKVEGKK